MLPATLRNTLLSLASFLPAHVLAGDDDSSDIVTFQFSACVSTCLASTGYSMDGEDNQREMCKASRDGLLLEAVAACTVSNCAGQLDSVDASLLQAMRTGCEELEKPVSDDETEAAASAALDIQGTLAASTSKSTIATLLSPAEPAETMSLGVESESSTRLELPAIPMPTAQTITAVEPVAATTMLNPDPLIIAEPTMSQAAVPAVETPTWTAQPPPEPTTIAEAPSSQGPNPRPAPESSSTQAGVHSNQIPQKITSTSWRAITIAKPTSTDDAITQPQYTITAHRQGPNNHNNSAAAVDTTTITTTATRAGATKTEASSGSSKATHTGDAGHDSEDDGDWEYDSLASASATGTSTPPDISSELVLATGTPTTSSSSSSSGFATSVTAAVVAASPSASGTPSAPADDVDGGRGGGSPFSVVMASSAPGGTAKCLLWAPLGVTAGFVLSLMMA
jgi:hypothetical protein